jgi:hypothetical protein
VLQALSLVQIRHRTVELVLRPAIASAKPDGFGAISPYEVLAFRSFGRNLLSRAVVSSRTWRTIMSKKTGPTPNDQRSVVKNPNNPAQAADQANRAKQAQGNAPAQPQKQPTPTSTTKK